MRAFIALNLPDSLKKTLIDFSKPLVAQFPPRSIRWVRPASIHLTLKFLGEIDPAGLPDLQQSLTAVTADTAPFTLQLGALGMFPNAAQPRVIWVGLDGDQAAVIALQQRVEAACAELGHPPEKRGFNPHLTLGRVRQEANRTQRRQIGTAVEQLSPPPPQQWAANELTLFQSELRPEGAVYTPLAVEPLAG